MTLILILSRIKAIIELTQSCYSSSPDGVGRNESRTLQQAQGWLLDSPDLIGIARRIQCVTPDSHVN